MITEKKLVNKFEHYKVVAKDAFKRKQFELALDAVETAINIARQYYLCYADEELEYLIEDISKSILGTTEKNDHNIGNKKIVFYEMSASSDALSRQYLKALIYGDYEILYLAKKGENNNTIEKIKEILSEAKSASICEIPNLSKTETAKFIFNEVKKYKPSRALIHTRSFDVAGVVAWDALGEVERFFVETSDHTFWIGTHCFDYCISFRSQGYNTGIQHRNIDRKKILLQPYYPIAKGNLYHGVPEINVDSVRILSGARLEKIYGKDDKYFELIENILKENPNVEFYFAGAGVFGKSAQMSYFNKQIKERQLGERFHILNYRDDLPELMSHMDIYMGTYPLAGALMTQIAASKGVPVVQFATDGLASGIGEIILKNEEFDFVFYNDESGFYSEIKKLVNDEDYRIKKGLLIKKLVLSEKEFNEQVVRLIEYRKSIYAIDQYDFSNAYLRDNQITVENGCTHDFPRIIVKSKYTRKKEPIIYGWYVIQFLITVDKKWLIKKIREAVKIYANCKKGKK